MFIAREKETGMIININEAIKNKKECICPICENDLIIKNGHINAPHFAHKTLSNCDIETFRSCDL